MFFLSFQKNLILKTPKKELNQSQNAVFELYSIW